MKVYGGLKRVAKLLLAMGFVIGERFLKHEKRIPDAVVVPRLWRYIVIGYNEALSVAEWCILKSLLQEKCAENSKEKPDLIGE